MSYLTVSGGSGSGWYAPGTVVDIVADACASGYTFDNWTATGGAIANASITPTTITTTSDNITVTRNCKIMGCSGMAVGDKATINGYAVVKLADNKCWQTSNQASSVKWNNRGSCPTGFNFPTKDDFDTLKGRYSGGGLYSAWGLSAYQYIYFWSSTKFGTSQMYALLVNGSVAGVEPYARDKTFNVRCYTTN